MSLGRTPALVAGLGTTVEGQGGIDPKAAEVLESMSAYMTGLNQFTYTASNTQDVVIAGNQTLTMFADSKVSVKRTNRVRSDRTGDMGKLQFYYDGQTLTLNGQSDGYYAQHEFGQNLDGMLEHIRDELGLEVPGADLLYDNPADELLEAAESGIYLGTVEVNGEMCHHLAFRTPDVDWQIWIETGDRPLPRRYSVTSKLSVQSGGAR